MPTAAIVGFGKYVPHYRIRLEEIAKRWGQSGAEVTKALGIAWKTVPGKGEDSFTMAFEASKQAIDMAGIKPTQISAIYVGSESHPYAVKPTSSMLASALELDPFCFAADLEFACKAGTAGMQIVDSFVRSGQIAYGMAIGTDTAQGRPGDALEYTAAAGAAAVIVGSEKSPHALCRIDATLSFTTDTPDFWRPSEEKFPHHAGRFTGEPAYFHHVRTALRGILETTKTDPKDLSHIVLHMPNAKFPRAIAKEFGFSKEQIQSGFIVTDIGNTYSACSLLGLVSVLQAAKKDERILLISYGSGSGSDAFLLTMLRDGVPLSPDTRPLEELSYDQYLEHCGILQA